MGEKKLHPGGAVGNQKSGAPEDNGKTSGAA